MWTAKMFIFSISRVTLQFLLRCSSYMLWNVNKIIWYIFRYQFTRTFKKEINKKYLALAFLSISTNPIESAVYLWRLIKKSMWHKTCWRSEAPNIHINQSKWTTPAIWIANNTKIIILFVFAWEAKIKLITEIDKWVNRSHYWLRE